MSKKDKKRIHILNKIDSKMIPKEHSFSLKHLTLIIGLMIAVALLAYANTFQVPFQFDDRPNILNNPDIQIKHFL